MPLSCGDGRSCRFDRRYDLASTVGDPRRLAITDQPASQPDGSGAGRDERWCILGGHATGGHDRDVGERTAQLTDERRPGNRGREELDRGGTRAPCHEGFGRRSAPRQGRDASIGRPGDEVRIDVWHHQECCPGVDSPASRLDRQDRPGADLQAVSRPTPGDRFQRSQRVGLRLVERQLERPDTSRSEGIGDGNGTLRVEMTCNRDDTAPGDALGDGRSGAAQVGLTVIC
jgi:hypothetical protein